MNFKIWAVLFALGLFVGWRVTSWAYDADYKSEVERVVKEHDAKVIESGRIIRASLENSQKTKIVYRTIKEKANATTASNCFNDTDFELWNDAATSTDTPKAGKPDDRLRSTASAIRKRLKIGTD